MNSCTRARLVSQVSPTIIHGNMDWFRKRRQIHKKTTKEKENLYLLETCEERQERWRSIYIIYFTMFLMSLGFSIILTGVWPYLDKLDPTAGKEFMGFIVGANPLAQMIFAPIVGLWGNRLGSIRLPLLLSTFLFTFASVMYSTLEAFDDHRKYWMLASRFLVGISSSNIAVCRSYLSAATTIKERTGAVSMVSLAQVLGFIVGPALQAAVTPLGDAGVPLIPGLLTLNMYTAAGWINVLLGVLNFILFLPAIFTERPIAAKEAMVQQGAATEEETWKSTKPDYISSWTLIVSFFNLVFNFVLLETLGTVLAMDQFAWSKEEALKYMGILMAVGAVLACITFAGIGPMCKRFPEKKVLVWGGLLLMVVGRFFCVIPWSGSPPLLAIHNATNNATEVVGCSPSQEWCTYVNALTITQFIIAYILTGIGYPIAVTLIQTIFSKILGSRPQGVWMGIMTAAGCCSRFMGPVFVSFIYTRHGPIWTFGITGAMLVISMAWLQLMEKRLTSADSSVKNGNVEKSDKNTEVRKKNNRDNGEQTFQDSAEMDALESDKLHEGNEITILARRES